MTKVPQTRGLETASALRRALRWLVAATIVLYLGMFGVSLYIYDVSRDNTEVLCTFRDDVTARLETSTQYLLDHPKGTRDIPLSVLKASIANSKRTRDSLSGISCPAPPKLPNPSSTPSSILESPF